MRPTSAGAFLIDDPLQSRSLVRDGQSARPAKDWATTPEDGTLWRIDPKTNDVTRVAMPHLPTGVTTSAGAVWVTVRKAS